MVEVLGKAIDVGFRTTTTLQRERSNMDPSDPTTANLDKAGAPSIMVCAASKLV